MDILRLPSRSRQERFAVRTALRLIFALAAGVLFFPAAAAPSNQSGRYEATAALLFNFAKFVEWPDRSFDDSQAPIVFGIIGGDQELAFHLQRLAAGQRLQGRNVVIRGERFGDDMRRCHVLFVSTSERQRIRQILASLQAASVLTVSEIDGFADAGGVVEFEMDQGQAHFVVNLDAAAQNKLRISAKLLALAHVVNHSQAAN